MGDDVSITAADENTVGVPDENCTQLVRNGDAEVGDTRFWYILGGANYGTIDIVSPGAGGTGNAFHHSGIRSLGQNGMLQQLDNYCMPICSKWRVYGEFKLFNGDGSDYACNLEANDKCTQTQETRRLQVAPESIGCPVLHIKSAEGGGGGWSNHRLVNSRTADFVNNDGWYIFEADFVVDFEMDSKAEFFLMVSNVESSVTYMVDNISVTKNGSSETCGQDPENYAFQPGGL